MPHAPYGCYDWREWKCVMELDIGLAKVQLKPRRALPFFNRHPWVFAGAVQRIEGEPQAGDEVALVSERGEFIARGLFNPDSNILVRLYSWDANEGLDEAFWSKRLDEAIELRRRYPEYMAANGGCRVVGSEGDGVSGLTVDRYGEWLLVQITSRALAARKDLLVGLLKEKLSPAGMWLRTEKGIREAEGLELQDGLIDGPEPPRPLFIEENGLRYGIDIVEGQKTGFFLDQRENRRAAARHLQSGKILDLFCYSGGFSTVVAKNPEVREILAVDVSEGALRLAKGNAELNDVAAKIRFEKADIFKWIETLPEQGTKYDGIILDPPKMARHKKSLPEALRAYHKLNRLAMESLTPGGILVSCSCSGHVSRELFESTLADAAATAKRRVQILESRGPALDHPTSLHCLENHYLKCLICRVL